VASVPAARFVSCVSPYRVVRSRSTAGDFHARAVPVPASREIWRHDITTPALVLGSTQDRSDIDIEASRTLLASIAQLLSSPELAGRKFRIEGHTDALATAPDGPFPTNWELSTARATNVLHYLVDFGVDEKQFQVAGFADTVPLASNDTPEGRAYNRRVDLIILGEGHL